MEFGVGAGEEPFAKEKEVDQGLEASPEARHKSYCHDELTKASVKKEDLEIQVAAHLRQLISKTSALDGEVAELHADLGSSARAVLETVEVMELVSLERVQQRTVEHIMVVPVTMHVETGQAQYAHRVMDVPVVGCTSSRPRSGFRRSREQAAAVQKPATTGGSARRERRGERGQEEKERRRGKKGQGQGGHKKENEKEEAKKQRDGRGPKTS